MRTTVSALGRERVAHLVHELPHEEDPAPVGLQEVLGGQRIRNFVRFEALPLILDLDLDRAVGQGEHELHTLRFVLAVAVLDRIGDRFTNRHRQVVRRLVFEPDDLAQLGQNALRHVQHLEPGGDVELDRSAV